MTSGQNRAKSSRGGISRCEAEVFWGGTEPLWLTGRGRVVQKSQLVS